MHLVMIQLRYNHTVCQNDDQFFAVHDLVDILCQGHFHVIPSVNFLFDVLSNIVLHLSCRVSSFFFHIFNPLKGTFPSNHTMFPCHISLFIYSPLWVFVWIGYRKQETD